MGRAVTVIFPRLPSAERVGAILAANRADNAARACPSCGTGPGVDCAPGCPLFELSRVPEPCDDCDGDARLCGCFWKYAPEPETQACYECEGRDRVAVEGEEDECDVCHGSCQVEADGPEGDLDA